MKLLLPILLFLSSFYVIAQEECFLGIGGKDDKTIAEIFDLSHEQLRNLRNWSAELKYRNEIFILRAESLLKNHPSGSHEDLLKMSYAYKGHLDSMTKNLRLIDKRMLASFNDQQYHIYVQLCNSVLLNPIFVNRNKVEKKK